MATLSLDPHLLVRLDAKSTPRVRSFRERVRDALLCVLDACALDAPACLLSPWHTTKRIAFGLISQEHVPCWQARTDSLSLGAGRVE